MGDLNYNSVSSNRDTFVDEQYNRIIAGEALRKADEFGRIGQLEQARGMLDKAMGTVKSSRSCKSRMSKNLLSDMAETKKGYATKSEYRTWGKHITKQNAVCLRRERAAKSSDVFGQHRTQATYMNVKKIHTVAQFNDSCSDDSDEAESKSTNSRIRAFSMKNKKPSHNWSVINPPRFSLNKDAGTALRNRKKQYVSFQDFMRSLPPSNIKPSTPETPKGAELAFPIARLEQCSGSGGTMPTEENKSSKETLSL